MRLDSTKKKKSTPVLSEKPKNVAEKLPNDAIAADPENDDFIASATLLIDASVTNPKDDATVTSAPDQIINQKKLGNLTVDESMAYISSKKNTCSLVSQESNMILAAAGPGQNDSNTSTKS